MRVLMRGFALCCASLSLTGSAYRVSHKKVLKARSAMTSSDSAQDAATEVEVVDAGAADNVVESAAVASPATENAQSASLAEYEFAKSGSKRSIGNFLATLGLMRANAIISASSKLLPGSLSQASLPREDAMSDPAEADIIRRDTMAFLSFYGVCLIGLVVYVWAKVKSALDIFDKEEQLKNAGGSKGDSLAAAIRQGCGIAIPSILMFVISMSNEVASTVCLGRVGTKQQLAAIGLSNMLANCLVMSFAFGLNSPMDTLVSQAHGSGNTALGVIYMQRARFVSYAQLVWAIPLLWNAEIILIALGQDREVAGHASVFCRVYGITAPLMYHAVTTLTFLKNVGDPTPNLWVMLVGIILHIMGCIIFVLHLGYGNMGIAMALGMNLSAVFLLSSVYITKFSDMKHHDAVSLLFVTSKGLENLMSYIRLALPSLVSTCAEFWYWEINTLLVGMMGDTTLAAHVALVNFQGICQTFGIGVGTAVGTLVGTALGAGQISLARLISWGSEFLCLGMWTFSVAIILLCRGFVASAYSRDEGVQEIFKALLLFNMMGGFFNTAQICVGGALKGMAMQKKVAIAQFVSLYIIALGSGCFLAFVCNMGVYGIYASFGLGLTSVNFCLNYFLADVDFDKMGEETKMRMENDSKVLRKTSEKVVS